MYSAEQIIVPMFYKNQVNTIFKLCYICINII